MRLRALVVIMVSASVGCGGEGSPSAPSAIPVVQPAPAAAVRPLFGYVADTAFRAVAGATVEVVSGAHAGLATTSNADGGFVFDQDVASPSVVRASKDGYAIGTRTSILTSDGRAYASFSLAALGAPADVAGNYTLTITADDACADLPDDLRTRTYPATVRTAIGSSAPANTRFDGTVVGGQFAPYANLFFVGVFGDYVTISTEGEGPTIAEHVGGNRYLAFSGGAGASVGPDGLLNIAAPFAGTIEYCELTAPVGQYYACSTTTGAVRHECQSTRHRLTLTRR